MSSGTVRNVIDEHVPALEATTSVAEAIEAIRTASTGTETTVYYAYVLDEDDHLEGVVSMRELLNASGDTALADVMIESVVTVEEHESVGDVARTIAANEFAVLPVVDDEGQFSGVVRAEDVIEALDDEATKDVLKDSVHDVDYDPSEAGQYECFECGNVVVTANADTCPDCGGELRNLRTTLE
ncbi:rubrerythrin-like domain-containing protein [Natrialbaceae archaeon AArc-T1-2]|uniref:rubrerythrin-like domain-containing protein n=1 Tax=Natrialbaceae archaeon AArc-T1-2 TaxID=3053904 RepID=UPI00255AE996|nr:rubrerythrin-like domain-containing protein [Natrialbaceae archaeon AArc-T1-2]WIV65925.1 rubrerythrin-like domain-containing protein [Natrialbaceae archaeon AArc-T1-2]